MYVFKSSIGLFWIKQVPSGWHLGIDNEILGTYQSAVAAADDVYVHVTGCYDWDKLDGIEDAPTDIYEWDFVNLSK